MAIISRHQYEYNIGDTLKCNSTNKVGMVVDFIVHDRPQSMDYCIESYKLLGNKSNVISGTDLDRVRMVLIEWMGC